jgi:pSer/pThr/pTyr-binding forkhead associated (FHA) protein
VITDLRATNGVEVQGKRIRGSVILSDGDQLRIGSQEFTVEILSG